MTKDTNSWLKVEPYLTQQPSWPTSGKHIMAQYSPDYIVVYQAYRPEIGQYAAKHQHFGGAFSYNRVSWIKPNFLWMMFRSGWGTKVGQETTLAIYLKPDVFQSLFINAFPSTNSLGMDKASWKAKVANTDVRLQWDPDHDPNGNKLERRAIQLGLRNQFLAPFKGEGIVRIEDISDFVAEQRVHVRNGDLENLTIPQEKPFEVDELTKQNQMMQS